MESCVPAIDTHSSPSPSFHVSGAACVVFTSHSSYIAAVSARFMQLSYGDMEKKVIGHVALGSSVGFVLVISIPEHAFVLPSCHQFFFVLFQCGRQ